MPALTPPPDFAARAARVEASTRRAGRISAWALAVLAALIVVGAGIGVVVTGDVLAVVVVTLAVALTTLAFALPYVPVRLARLGRFRRMIGVAAWASVLGAAYLLASGR